MMRKKNRTWYQFVFLYVVTILFVLGTARTARMVSPPRIAALAAWTTFTHPDGSDDFVGEGNDFATQIWASPWTFDQMYDIAHSYHLAAFAITGGMLTGQVTGNDPHFFLLFPGIYSAINLNTGQQNHIDTDTYTRVAFKLCTPAAHVGQGVRLYWYDGYTSPYGSYYWSGIIPVSTGCGVYTYDLSASTNWTGQVEGLRFDLEMFQSGDAFTLDWFRLTEANDTSNTFPIQWTDLEPTNSTLELFLDDDTSGYDGFQIAQLSNAQASGTFNWGAADVGYLLPQDFEAGDYYVYAEIDGAPAGYSAAPLRVSQTPLIQFTDPSYTSGRDYATDNGNPWDMNSSSDGTVRNCTSYQFSGGQLDAYNVGNDPHIEFNTPVPIDTSFYRYFTIDFYSQYSFYTQGGGMSRVYWMNGSTTTTEDMIINVPGEWRTYTLDLSQVPIEGGGLSTWENSDWQTFRFDANENTTGVSWRWLIRDAKLTGPPEADERFLILWEIDNPEEEAVAMDIYYDTDNAGFDGTLIGSVTSSRALLPHVNTPDIAVTETLSDTYVYLPLIFNFYCDGNCMAWDTSTLLSGNEYFLYACLDDGVNQVCRYSDVPVLIRH